MAWETSLDRLLLQQIHLAEKGEVKPELVRQQLLDLRNRLRAEEKPNDPPIPAAEQRWAT